MLNQIQKLNLLLVAHNMTGEELAAKRRISKQAVYDWQANGRIPPGQIEPVAKIFEVVPESLADDRRALERVATRAKVNLLLLEVVKALESYIDSNGLRLSPLAKAKVVESVYDGVMLSGRVTSTSMGNLVRDFVQRACAEASPKRQDRHEERRQ